MPQFSLVSTARLKTCNAQLQHILEEAIKYVDFTVICGHRTEVEQNQAFEEKKSTLKWPHSKHNKLPSDAVDIAPYPIDWKDTASMARLVGYIERIAHEQGVKIRWGGDWNGNYRTRDEKFIDMPHIEVMR